ncbi:hypothetical protein, partial [Caldisericum sp.]|uniref:hypothetical protein n=1 Tax=Caldisericum sp. TaxID=2499687 RepID=UPI003D0B16D5
QYNWKKTSWYKTLSGYDDGKISGWNFDAWNNGNDRISGSILVYGHINLFLEELPMSIPLPSVNLKYNHIITLGYKINDSNTKQVEEVLYYYGYQQRMRFPGWDPSTYLNSGFRETSDFYVYTKIMQSSLGMLRFFAYPTTLTDQDWADKFQGTQIKVIATEDNWFNIMEYSSYSEQSIEHVQFLDNAPSGYLQYAGCPTNCSIKPVVFPHRLEALTYSTSSFIIKKVREAIFEYDPKYVYTTGKSGAFILKEVRQVNYFDNTFLAEMPLDLKNSPSGTMYDLDIVLPNEYSYFPYDGFYAIWGFGEISGYNDFSTSWTKTTIYPGHFSGTEIDLPPYLVDETLFYNGYPNISGFILPIRFNKIVRVFGLYNGGSYPPPTDILRFQRYVNLNIKYANRDNLGNYVAPNYTPQLKYFYAEWLYLGDKIGNIIGYPIFEL